RRCRFVVGRRRIRRQRRNSAAGHGPHPRGGPRVSTLRLGNYGTTAPPEPDPRSISVGQVHLGLGAFHRAHQAVYTEDAIRHSGETLWGIAAFTQRSGAAAARLTPQDGLYTVVERG